MSQPTDPPAERHPSVPEAAPSLPAHLADSAGQPWAGRSFEPNTSAADDGTAPPRLIEALRRFQARELGQADVVDAVRDSRLLIPLVAQLGESGLNEHGHTVDKSQELAIVTVAGPDGRNVLPVFSSVAAMAAWNPTARPVPADGVRVALAAASEDTELVVLDPTSETEFAIRRPALWAVAQGQPWAPSFESDLVAAAFGRSIETELAVLGVRLMSGDPQSRLVGPELVVELELVDGLDRGELDTILGRLARRWAADDSIATAVDSLTVRLVASR
ncbi:MULTISPECIES: SseB family protein [unclassified Leifsonia]|uniref:SseB family protein n=1 Tax=unclassified Leifsonia TaxID=2663824 RepID=UPI0006F4937E|nr:MULTISPECIES: SseB family protein [unclassified Leifsonia]KQX05719.1 hypothetical protein ASC59_16775 [Leifsonia sp. Root1293]KRA09355.1 hypothetical protein ASD61_16770 [Leifsonia sp. Root60]